MPQSQTRIHVLHKVPTFLGRCQGRWCELRVRKLVYRHENNDGFCRECADRLKQKGAVELVEEAHVPTAIAQELSLTEKSALEFLIAEGDRLLSPHVENNLSLHIHESIDKSKKIINKLNTFGCVHILSRPARAKVVGNRVKELLDSGQSREKILDWLISIDYLKPSALRLIWSIRGEDDRLSEKVLDYLKKNTRKRLKDIRYKFKAYRLEALQKVIKKLLESGCLIRKGRSSRSLYIYVPPLKRIPITIIEEPTPTKTRQRRKQVKPKFSHRQKQLIDYLRVNPHLILSPHITARIAEDFGIASDTTQKMLETLREKGINIPTGEERKLAVKNHVAKRLFEGKDRKEVVLELVKIGYTQDSAAKIVRTIFKEKRLPQLVEECIKSRPRLRFDDIRVKFQVFPVSQIRVVIERLIEEKKIVQVGEFYCGV